MFRGHAKAKSIVKGRRDLDYVICISDILWLGHISLFTKSYGLLFILAFFIKNVGVALLGLIDTEETTLN